MTLHRQIRSAGPYVITLGPSKLYLDDIQDMVNTIEDFTKDIQNSATSENKQKVGQITIVAGNATADAVEDLREATQSELSRLSIVLSSPRLRIDLWKYSADISTDTDDLKVRALADDIAIFVNNKKMRTRGIGIAFLLSAWFWVAAIVSLILATTHSKSPYLLWAGAFAGLGLLGVIAAVIVEKAVGFNKSVRIIAAKRAESKRISERARRDIVVGTVAAVIGAVVIGAAGLWAGLLVK